MATRSSILAWRIPWTEHPGRLQSMGSQRVGHNWSNLAHINRLWYIHKMVCKSPTLQADSLLSEPPGKPFQWLYWVEKFSWSLTFLTKWWSSSSISTSSLSCNLNLFVSPQQAYSSASMLHGEKALWNQSWLPILLASHLSQWSDVQMTCSNLIESERIMRLPYPLGCEEVHYRIL